jgi:hypothetical protein
LRLNRFLAVASPDRRRPVRMTSRLATAKNLFDQVTDRT